MRCRFQYNDGGRAAAGFKGKTGDCVTRAIAIATGKPYAEVYEEINEVATRGSARTGLYRKDYQEYLKSLGWRWVPCVTIGSGCKVHLRRSELPAGRIIVRLSKHLSAVIDGTINDTFNPSRAGTRCVYGYYEKDPKADWKEKLFASLREQANHVAEKSAEKEPERNTDTTEARAAV